MALHTTLNPIIPGFAPDPSIVQVDGWFFLTTSTFHLFPGLPIYASRDLCSWEHIGNAVNRPEQLSLCKSRSVLSDPAPETGGRVLPAAGGLYAPTIRFHNGVFYIVCTNALRDPGDYRARKENFILSTTDIWKDEWSDPVYFDFEGIDPSIFFDDTDGKVYIQGSATPGPATRINNFEINIATGGRLSAERTIWTGTGGVFPEGPHIIKKDDWYVLLIAEGGTHLRHSVTAARSKHIWGPYTAAPHNPLLTACNTDEYIQHIGHADVFEDQAGQWFAVCLGVRNLEGRYVLSRETFLTTAHWKEGWLYIDPVKSEVKDHSGGTLPSLSLSAKPAVDSVYVRDAQMDHYKFEESCSGFTLTTTNVDLSSPDASPTFIARRQRHLQGMATTTVSKFDAAWTSWGVKFGLACYKDEDRFLRVYLDMSDKSVVFEVVNMAQKISRVTRHATNDVSMVSLAIDYTEAEYTMRCEGELGGPEARQIVDTSDMTDPDFVGPIIGIFAISDSGSHDVRFDHLSVD